jgi:hypothetical protein
VFAKAQDCSSFIEYSFLPEVTLPEASANVFAHQKSLSSANREPVAFSVRSQPICNFPDSDPEAIRPMSRNVVHQSPFHEHVLTGGIGNDGHKSEHVDWSQMGTPECHAGVVET